MHSYCFEFKSSVALTDKAQVDIANNIRANSPDCCGIRIRECNGVEPDKAEFSNILEEANHLIFSDRNEDYGHPLDDFTCTASMWTAYLKHRGLLRPGVELRAEDVPMMMISVKQSRYANAPKRDNIVDIAGYAGTIDMCDEKRKKNDLDALHLVEEFPPIDDVVGD